MRHLSTCWNSGKLLIDCPFIVENAIIGKFGGKEGVSLQCKVYVIMSYEGTLIKVFTAGDVYEGVSFT